MAAMLTAAVMNCVLAVGLLRRSRIAYIAGAVLAVLGAVVCLLQSNIPAVAFDVVFVALLLHGYSWFFPGGLARSGRQTRTVSSEVPAGTPTTG